MSDGEAAEEWGAVYMVTCEANGKIYIGQTRVGVSARWAQHLSSARGESACPFHRAIRRYGDAAFRVETLETVPVTQLGNRERYWIAELGALIGGGGGYNVQEGGKPSADELERLRRSVSRRRRLEALVGDPAVSSVRIRRRARAVVLCVRSREATLYKPEWAYGELTPFDDAYARAYEWALRLVGGDAARVDDAWESTRRAPAMPKATRVPLADIRAHGCLYAMVQPMTKYVAVWCVAHEGVLRRRDMTRADFPFTPGDDTSRALADTAARAFAASVTADVRTGLATKRYRGSPQDVAFATLTVRSHVVEARCHSRDGSITRMTFRIGTSGRSSAETLAHAQATVRKFTDDVTVHEHSLRGHGQHTAKRRKLLTAVGERLEAGAQT